MNLSETISQLLNAGKVILAATVETFTDEDMAASLVLLKNFHAHDSLEMPERAPDFMPEPAMWGAMFVYRAMQLCLIRDLGSDAVESLLPTYGGTITSQTTYSADLCLRKLPELRNLSGGLAPGDPLVTRLEAAAHRWPLSSVGLLLNDTYDPIAIDLRPILDHASLRMEYVDRIIAEKDRKRSEDPRINPFVQAALGDYAQKFWPAFEAIDTIHQP
jgi:hypothetical protein